MLQALVEFESIDVAKKAKHAMNGADIYSGCCTLKVEFAKVVTSFVFDNKLAFSLASNILKVTDKMLYMGCLMYVAWSNSFSGLTPMIFVLAFNAFHTCHSVTYFFLLAGSRQGDTK